jgi:hypothetical protein
MRTTMPVAERAVVGLAIAILTFCVVFLLVEATALYQIGAEPGDGPAIITANIDGFMAGAGRSNRRGGPLALLLHSAPAKPYLQHKGDRVQVILTGTAHDRARRSLSPVIFPHSA